MGWLFCLSAGRFEDVRWGVCRGTSLVRGRPLSGPRQRNNLVIGLEVQVHQVWPRCRGITPMRVWF